MSRGTRLWLVGAALVATGSLALGLGRTDFWPPDEARVAEIAREMGTAGNLLIPRLDGQPFLEEPPLFYWLQLGAFRLAGAPSTVAARLPAAAAAIAGVLATAAVAHRLGVSPLLALLVLATAPEYWWMARSATPDTAAAAATTVALGFFLAAWQSGRRAPLVAAVAACGVAFWCKSLLPVGLVIVTGAIFLASAGRGRLRARDVVLALVGVAIVAGVWVLLMARELGAEAVAFFLIKNHVRRLLGGPLEGHVRSVTYYVVNLALGLFPWSFALPAAAVAAWRQRGVPAHLFPLVWAGAMTVTLTLSATKRAHYLLPAYPSFALLVAQWAPAAAAGRLAQLGRRLMLAVPLIVGPVVALVLVGARAEQLMSAGAAWTPAAAWLVLREATSSGTGWLLLVGLVLLSLAVAAVSRTRSTVRTAAALGVYLTVLHLLLTLVVLPRFNPLCTARPWAERLARLADRGRSVVAFRFKETEALSPFMFYAGRQFPVIQDAETLVTRLHAGAACVLLQEPDYDALAARLPASPAARGTVGGMRLVLVETSPGLCADEQQRAAPS
jgi:4-amino-4-deoxy-L-arabinose transferase-like glycosyltransferase